MKTVVKHREQDSLISLWWLVWCVIFGVVTVIYIALFGGWGAVGLLPWGYCLYRSMSDSPDESGDE
jgi:hypothetical protein